jgi:hypothetical protein
MSRKKNTPTTDQTISVRKTSARMSVVGGPVSSDEGLAKRANMAAAPLPSPDESKSPAGGLRKGADKAGHTLPPAGDATIDLIIVCHGHRRFAMESRKRQDLALGARLRTLLGWRKDLPEAERKAIAVQAAALAKNPTGSQWQTIIEASATARQPWDTVEKAAVKEMEALAESLPVWPAFGKEIRGFGSASLAIILAEAGGPLSNYPTIAKLWKRMGLAVMGDVRQGGLPKGASAEEWIAHGYNKQRRSRMWNVGDTLLKAQIRKVKDEAGEDTGERTSLGVYGALYLTRKRYEIARDPEIKPIIAHRRAQRYAEKRLLRDLWQAWRRAARGVAETPLSDMPADRFKDAA